MSPNSEQSCFSLVSWGFHSAGIWPCVLSLLHDPLLYLLSVSLAGSSAASVVSPVAQGSQKELLRKLNITLSFYLAKEHWQIDVATPQVGWRVIGETVFWEEDGRSCLISLPFWCTKKISAHTSCVLFPLFSSCTPLREGVVEPLSCPPAPPCFFDRKASWMPLLLQTCCIFDPTRENCRLTYKLRLGCWHASGDKINFTTPSHLFIYSLIHKIFVVCLLLPGSMYRGCSSEQNQKLLSWSSYSFKMRAGMQAYFLLHNFILHIRSWVVSRSFSLHFISKKKSFTASSQMLLKWWTSETEVKAH